MASNAEKIPFGDVIMNIHEQIGLQTMIRHREDPSTKDAKSYDRAEDISTFLHRALMQWKNLSHTETILWRNTSVMHQW